MECYIVTKCIFITGTDTNVGKTLVACTFLQKSAELGYRVVGYKPVVTGCKVAFGKKISNDTTSLIKNSNVKVSEHQVSPLMFIDPVSPHIASRKEGKCISISDLSVGFKELKKIADWLIIEGVGGWLTPLEEDLTYADWVISESIPVVLVVGVKIGCINHALLTELAIRKSGVNLVGWVFNCLTSHSYWINECLVTLKNKINAPMLGKIPYIDIQKNNLTLSSYLNLPRL